jgi:hypothetical protein
VWPKTTAVTAAAVGALAQAGSSPRFRQQYPEAAAAYLQKAQLGWKFLTNAIARFGKDGAYQKITGYGDDFMHDDELAWAACEMYLATGDSYYHQKLMEWFPNPADPATYRWGWWRLAWCYGNAIRSYAFAGRTGRIPSAQLNAAYLSKCEGEILAAANDAVTWSRQNAYGTSFPYETKQIRRAGWYFSSDYAADIAVAYQLSARPEFIDALVANMNYESGCNPVNVSYVSGLGWKRQREIVHQYAQNDRRVLPPTGIPLGNVQEGFYYMDNYKSELNALCFPGDWVTTAPQPFYDRWADAYNVMTEFIHINQARSLMMYTLLSSFTSAKSLPWTSAFAQIAVPNSTVPVDAPTALTVQAPGLSLDGARIVWEGRDQEPAYGPTFMFRPKNNGTQWVEVDVQWPDGRRVFATNSFYANSPVVAWVDDALPSGAQPSTGGGDSWSWVSSPAPFHGTVVHASAIAAGLHEHYFDGATATLDINAGDMLFAYVYMDPANVPSEVMLCWNDGTWEHRAYWGANAITYGNNGTDSRRFMGALPAAGQWARLEVPASQVGLEGRTLKGMAFSLFGGRATWDYAGKSNSATNSPGTNAPNPSTLSVSATDPNANEASLHAGVFTIRRAGDLSAGLTVNYTVSGTALAGIDYQAISGSVSFAPGVDSATVLVTPLADAATEGPETVVLTIAARTNSYALGSPTTATVTLIDSGGDSGGGSGPTVTVTASKASATIGTSDYGAITFTRSGTNLASGLVVNYSLGGTAVKWNDYRRPEGDMPLSITIPAGATSYVMNIMAVTNQTAANPANVVLTLSNDANYMVGAAKTATVTLVANPVPVSVAKSGANMRLTWVSTSGKIYQVAFKNSLSNAGWTNLGPPITATGPSTSYLDTGPPSAQRFYRIYRTNYVFRCGVKRRATRFWPTGRALATRSFVLLTRSLQHVITP